MYTIEFLALFNSGECTLGELTEVLLEPDGFWDRKISRLRARAEEDRMEEEQKNASDT